MSAILKTLAIGLGPGLEPAPGVLAALIDAAYADIKRRLDLERFVAGARG